MAFLIRTIDLTADGREIVRERELDLARLTIGRASENDLHLPDLAVEQRHAFLEVGEDGSCAISSTGGLAFTVDGRKVEHAAFEPHIGTELGFGGYRITVAREGDGPVALTVRRVSKTAGARDVKRGFALAGALPGKRPMAWIALVAVLAAFLAIPVATNLARAPAEPDFDGEGQTVMDASWSTGALSLAHHGLEDNCEACHVEPFVSVRDQTCLTCHEDIADHADIARQNTGRGPLSAGDRVLWAVAGGFGKEGPGSCTTCHTEHEGEGRMEPPAQQFCAECHDGLDTRLTDTALASAADFGEAHPQFKAIFHPTLGSGETRRMSLSEGPVERHGLRFPHRLHLDPDGGVARMAGNIGAKKGYGEALVCADCHRPTADRAGFLPVEMEEDCEACHSLVYDRVGPTFRTLRHGDVAQLRADLAAMDRAPRRPIVTGRRRPGEFAQGGLYYQEFGRPNRSLVGINRALSPDGVCGECHIPTSTNGRPDVVPVYLRGSYLLNGWFDHEEHRREECTTCHAAEQSGSSSDLLLPGIAICRDCHLGEDATDVAVPSSCAMCHSYHPKKGRLPADHPDAAPDRVARMSRKAG